MEKQNTESMKDFEDIYETGGEWPDYLKCTHCGQRVERGIVTVSHHYMNCLERKEGLIVAQNDFERKLFDSMSINVKTKH